MARFDKTVCVMGLGYIGLPTAAVFAGRKKHVIGIDINQHAVDTINQGKIHIVEPGLEDLVKQAVQDGHLSAHTCPQKADAEHPREPARLDEPVLGDAGDDDAAPDGGRDAVMVERKAGADAQAKRERKGVPLLVGNIGPDTFGQDDNALLLVDAQGTSDLPKASKLQLARQLVAEIALRLPT